MNLARYRKFLVAAVGVVAMVVSSGLVTDNHVLVILNAVLGVATAFGVRQVPNRHPMPGPGR